MKVIKYTIVGMQESGKYINIHCVGVFLSNPSFHSVLDKNQITSAENVDVKRFEQISKENMDEQIK